MKYSTRSAKNNKLNELQTNEQPNECKAKTPDYNATEQMDGWKSGQTIAAQTKKEFNQQQQNAKYIVD